MSRSKILAGLVALSCAPGLALFAQPAPAPKPAPRPAGAPIVISREALAAGDCRGAGFTAGKRAFLGVEAARLTSELRRHFGAAEDEGVLVSRVVEGGPAARAGIAVGDVVIRCAGERVAAPSDLRSAVKGRRGGEAVPVELYRGGKLRQLNVQLDEKESCVFDLGQVIDPEELRELGELGALKIDLKDLEQLKDLKIDLKGMKELKELDELKELGIEVGNLDLDGLVRNAVNIAVVGLDQALKSKDWERELEGLQEAKAELLERRMEEVSRQLEILEERLQEESGRYGEKAKQEVEKARQDLHRELERSRAEMEKALREAREEAERKSEEARRQAEKAARDAARAVGSGGSGGEREMY